MDALALKVHCDPLDDATRDGSDVVLSPAGNKKWYQGGEINIRGFYNPHEIADWKKMRDPNYYKTARVGLQATENEQAGGSSSSNGQGQHLSLECVSGSMERKALSSKGTEEDQSSTACNDQTEKPAITDHDKTKTGQPGLEDVKGRLVKIESSIGYPSAERRGRPMKNNGSKTVACEVCSKMFSSLASKNIHLQNIHLGRMWHCKYCHLEFSAPSTRSVHTKICLMKPTGQPAISGDAGTAQRNEAGLVN